ncbi:TPA: alkaline shock response membrane anchor protein AmaP [Streptococcus equi subsp. zooepidemicus]|nr:alkaline shock response membrane anchor protein AmaP [Streptococcus equi subsp. zooepidemicus]
MSKFLKISYSLIGLVLLTVFGGVIAITGDYIRLPIGYQWLHWDMNWLPKFLNPALYYYYFWAAIALFLITVLVLLVIIFYPRTYTEIHLAKDKGTLLLKGSAIEGYVAAAIKAAGLMSSPRVTAKLYKRKFKVNVSGQLASRVAVTEQLNGIKEGIETGLTEFFGINRPVHFKVYVKDIADAKQKHSSKRRVE